MASIQPFTLPAIHEFPPFYTLQPNPASRSKQLSQWRSLILEFCSHHRIFYVDPSPTPASTAEQRDIWHTLFQNKKIARKLSPESVKQILAEMVTHHEAVWENPKANQASRAMIYWRSPMRWAQLIYDWVTATGQNKSIMTLFELTQGDLVQGQEFQDLPIPLLKEALQLLSMQGKAQIFAGTEAEDGEGVKFV